MFMAGISIGLLVSGQVPQLIDYQGMARDGSGTPIASQGIAVKIEIVQGPLPGTVNYSELHFPITNSYGLFNFMIGDGAVISGSFPGIDWGTGDYFLHTEIDPAGGASYIDMGMSKLATVPFAFYAASSGGGSGGNIWQQNGDDIYYDAGRVGVGTSTPDADLHVEDRIRVGEDPAYLTVYGELSHEGGGNGFIINANAGGGTWADMHLQTNGSTKMFIESSGKVGIGTISPEANLEVNGTTKLGSSGAVFSEIKEFTGTTGTSDAVVVSYPSDYTQTNTRVLSLEIKYENAAWQSMGNKFPNIEVVVSCSLHETAIVIHYPDNFRYHNKPFRMILMKME